VLGDGEGDALGADDELAEDEDVETTKGLID
jgi:hypothetical protein